MMYNTIFCPVRLHTGLTHAVHTSDSATDMGKRCAVAKTGISTGSWVAILFGSILGMALLTGAAWWLLRKYGYLPHTPAATASPAGGTIEVTP